MKKWGLTGGIGAGKSMVAKQLQEAGVPVVDLDQIGREITERSSTVIRQIEDLLGKEVVSHGKLIRRKVRDVIFKDAEKRTKLEALLHPLILSEFNTRASNLNAPLVICEAALHVESGFYKKLDGLILVVADEALRLKRLTARDQMAEDLAKSMIRAQISDEEKLKVASHVIYNNGTPSELRIGVNKLVKQLQS